MNRALALAAASFALAAALFPAATTPLSAYADGAPPGFTGGFKEQSCHACHFEAEPNTKPGEVTLTGVPDRFVPGRDYPVTVTLSRPGMKLAGFQLAARFEDGTQAGAVAAAANDAKRIKVETESGIRYASQRRDGAAVTASDRAQWELVWTAPMRSAPVTIHVAANAANGDESASGDYVFTTSATAAAAP